MAVSVQFEIGHTAKLRAKKTPEGFTHDWELYVRGSNKADISTYVDRVVFNLHESFQRPKRTVKEPPYAIHESGYAGFILNIDIYFRNRDEPKRVSYAYDLDLQNHGPPHHRSEERKFLFENPSEEFRQKLLKGGGVPVVPSGLTGSRNMNPNILQSNFSESSASNNKHKSINSGDGNISSKKHRSRTDESKSNTFANLFGTPDSTSSKTVSGVSSKAPTEALKPSTGVGAGKIYSPNASNTSSHNNVVKEKSSKEGKEKIVEKSKDKSERKEKHKSTSNSSPSKEARSESKKSVSGQSNDSKFEKRPEDKPKKDKSRDKERDRSRNELQTSNTATSTNSTKSVNINKSNSGSTSNATMSTSQVNPPGNVPAQRSQSSLPLNAQTRPEDKTLGNNTKPDKSEKHEKEIKDKHSSSSSSGKKSKKEKKDKDKDKDKDRDKDKERDKEKRSSGESKTKDDRSHLNTLQSNISNSPGGLPVAGSFSANTQKSKKSEKEYKQENLKTKLPNLTEKTIDKQIITPSSTSSNGNISSASADKKSTSLNNTGSNISNNSSSSSATKTHKHKKKEKNKEKEKERERISGGDKEKDKPKEKHNKEKIEERRETSKASENSANKPISPELKKPVTSSSNVITTAVSSFSMAQTFSNVTPPSFSAAENPIVKKAQNKEKKSKDSKSSKDPKRRSETPATSASVEPKSKVSKTNTPLSTAGSNIELSDADSHHSTHEPQKLTPMVPSSSEITELHSDSSYCSFSDIAVKQNEKSTNSPIIPSAEKGNSRNSTINSKENKQREKDKNATKNVEKPNRAEKEEKKRRRSTVTTTPETSTFVEPPSKQAKKEYNKTTTSRDSTKSPLPRSNPGGSPALSGVSGNTNSTRSNTKNNVETQNSNDVSNLSTASPTAATSSSSLPLTSGNYATNIVNNTTHLRTTPLPTSPALNNDPIWPNLSELQELHRKIMTLQDNDDLQQVVEMIAASGCYELTQRTFDFDLCKLDRSTVERLQEFFATSVS